MIREFFDKVADYSARRYRADKKFVKHCTKLLDSYDGTLTKSTKSFLHKGYRYKVIIQIDD
ncbi:hypothetical protein [Turicimonas muris]|uniref:hypothetical protein n=1 Tax=Turicimonas muris TaxID=1796652 RepID=UPI002638E5AA|nr:hypothetical protein [Turicimonas muris]